MYGQTWADRLGRLLAAYRVPQARLAAVIGLSPPMVSQLISGHRVKIANPAVYGRVVRLEELLVTPGVQAGDPAVLQRVLDEVAASSPALTTTGAAASPPDRSARRALVVGELVELADAPTLRAAASVVDGPLRAVLLDAASAAEAAADG